MSLGNDDSDRVPARSSMQDALDQAKHTLELLKSDVKRGSNVDPATISDLEADIKKYDKDQ